MTTKSQSSQGSSSSRYSSESSLNISRSGDETVIDWKERCVILEGAMVRYREKVARIRQVLADKMKQLEERAAEAEEKARLSQHKCEGLEQQLLLASAWQPAAVDKKLHMLETMCEEKEQEIAGLQAQLLENQWMMGEMKRRIRDWAGKKLRELEEKNVQLSGDNEHLQTQVEELRTRLQALPIDAARQLHRLSVQTDDVRPVSDMSDLSPPVPQRPSDSILETIRLERALELAGVASAANHSEGGLSHDPASYRQDPDYQEIEEEEAVRETGKPGREATGKTLGTSPVKLSDKALEKSAGKSTGKSVGPPEVRIERKHFPSTRHPLSVASSTNGSEEMLLELPWSSRKRDPQPASQPCLVQAPPVHSLCHPLMPLPSTSCQQYPTLSLPPPHLNHTVSALATLPRRRRDKVVVNSYSNQCADTHIVDRRLLLDTDKTRTKPPTPPMRRQPSWESRIYAVASVGLRMSTGQDSHCIRESSWPVTDCLYSHHMYHDLTVPVYTHINGRAAQIRSTPFTGDSSSDSSSDEEEYYSQVAVTTPSSESEAVMSVAGPSGTNVTMSMTVRKQVNQTSSGATKRGVTRQSVASETSSDYALPPDDDDLPRRTDGSDTSEPEHKLLKCTNVAGLKKESLEKSGFLTKLGGKVKSWKRRYFLLKDSQLLYYKSAHDVAYKPQGCIVLDGHTHVSKTDGLLTFQIVTRSKTYYLSADSRQDLQLWIRVLQNVLRKQASDKARQLQCGKEAARGWLIKTRLGRSKRCWCVLTGKSFIYYKKKTDKTPLGQIHLWNARIEEVDRSKDSGSDSDDLSLPHYTIAIWPVGQEVTYLMIATCREKDSWMYQLTVASGGGSGSVGTNYEQLISKLMQADGDSSCIYWKHPVLLFSKEPLSCPLTTLPTEHLSSKALDMNRLCQQFINMTIEPQQLEFPVSVAQAIFEACIDSIDIQNELYCQLIKQTSPHPPSQHKASLPVKNLLLCAGQSFFSCDHSAHSSRGASSELPECKLNPSRQVMVQAWQLLAMAVSLFVPKQSILWYLKAHLQRHVDPRTEMGKYAVFCQRALERTLQAGGREARPSRMEVVSILLRNPYHHSHPLSIPVHFLSATYQVVSFDGSTTISEFVCTLNKELNMRDCDLSGFSLFTDDPAGQELEHCLKGHLKLCDVISKWEQAFLHHASQRGRPDTSRTVKLIYKNRLYFKSSSRLESEKERLLLCYQVNEEILHARFPISYELAVEVTALMAQIELGDLRGVSEVTSNSPTGETPHRPTADPALQLVPQVVEKFLPSRYWEDNTQDIRLLHHKVQEKWASLRGRTLADCVRIYLTVARKWPFFGSKLFHLKVKRVGEGGESVWLAVQEDGLSVLEYPTLRPLKTINYCDVITFGGYRDDFMLVLNAKSPSELGESRANRLLFSLHKAKILELTMLLASYINNRGQQQTGSVESRDLRLTLPSSHTHLVV